MAINDPKLTVTLTGWDKVFAQLGQLVDRSKLVGKELGNIGNISLSTFTKAQAGVLAFLKAADPTRMAIFETKLAVLSLEIGRTFIPILVKAIETVDQMIKYFHNLTDEQRENILHWTKIALEVLAVGAAIGVLVPAITQVVSVAKSLWTIVSLFGGWVKIALILVSLIALVAAKNGNIADSLGPLKSAWEAFMTAIQPLREAFERLWEKAQPILEKIGQAFGKVIVSLMPLVDAMMELQAVLLEAETPFLIMFGAAVVDTLETLADIITVIVDSIREAAEIAQDIWDAIPDLPGGDDKIKGKQPERGFNPGKGRHGGGDFGDEADKNSGKFNSMAVSKAPQFQAVADVYKKVQESAAYDPKREYEQALRDSAKQTASNTKRIADNTSKDSPATYGGGGDW